MKIFKHYKLKPGFSIIKDNKAKDRAAPSLDRSINANLTQIYFFNLFVYLPNFPIIKYNNKKVLAGWGTPQILAYQSIIFWSNSSNLNQLDVTWFNLIQLDPTWSDLNQIINLMQFEPILSDLNFQKWDKTKQNNNMTKVKKL